MPSRISVREPTRWLRLLLGFAIVFGLFQWSANALGSDRGQAGVLVGALVIAATFAVERVLFGQKPAAAARALGLGPPEAKGMLAAALVAGILWSTIPLFSRVTGASASFEPEWLVLVPGLFAQAGIAEELLFRGYLFGRLRSGRSFYRAAALAALPFVAVHLFLFLTLPWALAALSLLLSVALSFPFSRLFELGGSTIWAPALLHFVVQGTVKVVVWDDAGPSFALVWMAASALLPALLLAIPRSREEGGRR